MFNLLRFGKNSGCGVWSVVVWCGVALWVWRVMRVYDNAILKGFSVTFYLSDLSPTDWATMALPTEGRGASGISLAVLISLDWLYNSHWSCLTQEEKTQTDRERWLELNCWSLTLSQSVPVWQPPLPPLSALPASAKVNTTLRGRSYLRYNSVLAKWTS